MKESFEYVKFTSDPIHVWAVVESIRLTYGHLFNPIFATETSLIEPLPHQRIAVYQYLLKQSRLRFLLADDAGAGKTIMTGLYIREMLSRRLISRILIISPAGLISNWQREMQKLFSLPFRLITGSDSKSSNPFIGNDSNYLIISLDTLLGDRMFSRLQEKEVVPYDLVIFDEAHKLTANREADFYLRKTRRYHLAEALAGVQTDDKRWQLNWSCQHLLLLTATPHQGKEYPYYSLWRLLQPEVLSTIEAFNNYPIKQRSHHFIRRTKEEMVRFDGSSIYPMRISNTLSYDLSVGPISEQTLYEETTNYIQEYYNQAKFLNRSAARLAMSVFQRRLASSTYALMCSFARRLNKLNNLINDLKSGKISLADLQSRQQKLEKNLTDTFMEKTADEENLIGDREENELTQDEALDVVLSISLEDLESERLQVEYLLDLARQVDERGEESKFAKLREFLANPDYQNEKILIFTEHRDTLNFLTRRLEGMGFTDQVAQLHGGMSYLERDEQVKKFRCPVAEGGALYLIATDAAGEGINLQFCWLMFNYDIPWNPSRLEQRMGRIHRFGQIHDPVIIVNLVAGKTREGRVLKTLLEKLERIRKELSSDKVFDVVGRIFEQVSINDYIQKAITDDGSKEAVNKIDQLLTLERVKAEAEKDLGLFDNISHDVKSMLPQLNEERQQEELRRLLPGYVRRFVEKTAPLLNIEIAGSLDNYFTVKPSKPGALDQFYHVLASYGTRDEYQLTVNKPSLDENVIFLHPGEVVFNMWQNLIEERFGHDALVGAVFIDPMVTEPYLFHLLSVSVVREANKLYPIFKQSELLESSLIGLKQLPGNITQVAPEYLTLLRAGDYREHDINSLGLVQDINFLCREALEFTKENIMQSLVQNKRQAVLKTLPERIDFLKRGYNHQEAELLSKRAKYREKANAGDVRAKAEITSIRQRLQNLSGLRSHALDALKSEPNLIVPSNIEFVAHALVLPTLDPEDRQKFDQNVEAIAMKFVWDYEVSQGAIMKDVSKPPLAREAGLGNHPGFDLLSTYPDGQQLFIEVKGRATVGDVELTENEWIAACNLGDRFWIYAVFNCATSQPQLLRIQDPFKKLIVKTKTHVVISHRELIQVAI